MSDTKLLLENETAMTFQPQLAAWIGLNESILIQQVYYLSQRDKFGATIDGVKWVRMTLEEWDTEIPYLDSSTIRRSLKNLEEDGLIITQVFTGRSKWYRVNHEAIEALTCPVDRLQARVKARVKALNTKHNVSVQNGQIDNGNEELSVQNEQIHLFKMDRLSVQNEQLQRLISKTSSKELLPNGNSGDGPPNRGKKSKPKNKSSPPPQAVQVYRSVANRFPDKATWEMIDTTVGINQEALDFWKLVVRDYIACGFSKVNIKTMLEFFERRELPKVKGGKNGSKPTRTGKPGIITAAQGTSGDEGNPGASSPIPGAGAGTTQPRRAGILSSS